MSAACWADPLSRKERQELAARLSRACKRSWSAACYAACWEAVDLYLDVTEMAEVATS